MILMWLLILTFTIHCYAEKNPYDMFGIELKDTKDNFDSPTPPGRQYTAMEHYRELHRVLTRVLLRSFKQNEELFGRFDHPVEINLNMILTSEDIATLNYYCDANETEANKLSPDVINNLFSEAIRYATIVKPANFSWIKDHRFIFSICAILGGFFLIYCLRTKYVFCMIVLLVFFCQSFYQNYNSKLAKKMSMLSRYNGPPQHCKPIEQHSWMQMISQYFSSRPSSDECAHYYEHVLTDPIFATHLYDVFLQLIFQFPIVGFSSFGKGMGLLYDNLLEYIPLYFVIPMFLGSFVSIALLLVILCKYCLFSSNNVSCSKRRDRPKIKPKSSLTLKTS